MLIFRRKFFKAIILLFLAIVIIAKVTKTLNRVENDNLQRHQKHISYDKIIIDSNRNSTYKEHYLILEYTKIFGSTKFCHKIINKNNLVSLNKNEKYNLLDNCEYKNCFFTCDKKLIDIADGLLFHYSDLLQDVEKDKNYYNFLVKKRRREQVWMLWQDEAYVIHKKVDDFKFNWTISYYTHADAWQFAYGGVVIDINNNETNNIKSEFNKRLNNAVWFVSNCNSIFRINIGNSLGEYFPIIINGYCSKKFKASKIKVDESPCSRESKCEIDYLSSNKFYLAFESTNCSDYITEKFWRSLSFGLIPIVIQPSKESYERIAPVDSFIHAQDFNFDARLLAEYLQKVSNSFDLYLKHTKWRLNYKSYFKGEDLEQKRFCQLCTKLNKESSLMYYESISSWFNNQCRTV